MHQVTTQNSEIAQALLDLYKVTNRLETLFPDRHFTLDGHLLGSIGEVYAAERYGLRLLRADWKAHDGISPEGRLVQIKVTQRKSVGISEKPDYLIVLSVSEQGNFDEVYNGPGKQVWELFANRKRPKNGQFQVSLARLRTLNLDVRPDQRIPSLFESRGHHIGYEINASINPELG